MEMDTDSAYIAIAYDTLDEAIKPDMRLEYYETYGDWFPRPFCSEHKPMFVKTKVDRMEWKMKECCSKVFKYDRRTPGLFKEEFEGIGMVALNPKTYCCWSEDDSEKYSSKGLSKRTNRLTKENFMSVLQTKNSLTGINKGFIRKDNSTFTYQQVRTGLTYFYAKRRVCDDGTSTKHILI